ncbi:type II secretion system protein [Cellulomonas alba]|uniref:Prepilin-type N-terminal cleavage/methylation domain-containing protein n=1 Tax=Cellulomonas alba TaxID=3053467 RepID=A0ABT7SB60_9CELL|nr:prepilin-type N-terminal cleavage/methylation domain-containing protein [Cellulomonas alba]MDM7853413.1 prepilin-type N-terminal cleavage/methylation domain-containing protein [Cellulomonas alba]
MARIRKSMEEKDKGFTLIELLVVMIIIGILAAIAIPVFLNQRKKAEDTAAKADVSTLGKEIATYFVDWDGTTQVTAGENGNKWQVNGTDIGNRSKNVRFGGLTNAADDQTWCVYVTDAKGDKAVTGYKYSAEGGLEEGTC